MAQNIIDTKIREAYDTEANWIKYNPTLLSGQLAFSSDKYGKHKIGDGVSRWKQLQYTTLGWEDITGKPSTFSPSSHSHTVGNEKTLGFTKLYTETGAATDGAVTQKGVTEALDKLKYLCAPIGHTHTVAQIDDFPDIPDIPNIKAITNSQIDSLQYL